MGYFYILITAVLFSTMEIALKMTGGVFNPLQLTYSRFFVAGVLLLPFAFNQLKKRNISLSRRDFARFALLGFICVPFGMILYQFALLYMPASVVAVLFSCNPVFVILFAGILLRERIRRRNVVSLALQVLGIICIINPFQLTLSVAGIVFTIGSAAAFALYGVLGRRTVLRMSGSIVTAFSFVIGALQLYAYALVSHVSAVADFMHSVGLPAFANVPLLKHGHSLHTLPDFLYICVAATGGGYYFYFKSMEKTSAATASLIFYFKPILAPLLAAWILQEHLPVSLWVAVAVILVGSGISVVPPLVNEWRLRRKNKDKSIAT